MIRIVDIHDIEYSLAVKYVRDEIKTIGKKILVIIHGYGSSGSEATYKKLIEVRNIGKSRVKKGELTLSISGPDLNDPKYRALFSVEEMSKLNQYIVNSGVTIMKK
ncbi:hypothetical protein [Acholeplasma hippikon]|uniref:Smr domain n=1 Tax=Acholeplasma hippikon TaxID=264636 RepID=A0A449BIT6_9MOLU|nr:hypothetical protein [Acholeplasma hippikon]VEU82369.1 Uncharacterised protein [Acholeplasma hippikon]